MQQVKFYHYRQKPIDNAYLENEIITTDINIEAYTAEEANHQALDIGLDFDSGRFKLAMEKDGTFVIHIFGTKYAEVKKDEIHTKCFVFFKNGKRLIKRYRQ